MPEFPDVVVYIEGWERVTGSREITDLPLRSSFLVRSVGRGVEHLPGRRVTAFRPWMAVHGRYSLACPACGVPAGRIVYVYQETNCCARCQKEGHILAGRALSRLLKADWPKNIDTLERHPGFGGETGVRA